MKWLELMGQFSTVCLIIPFITLIALKLYRYKNFGALLIYHFLLICYLLMTEGVLTVSKEFSQNLGILFNFLEAPLILFFLLYLVNSKTLSYKISVTIIALVCFEIIVFFFAGFSIQSVKIILAPGILLVLIFSFIIYSKYIRSIVKSRNRLGKMLINTAILFAYSIYTIIYIFLYIVDTPDKADAILIYHLNIIVSSFILTLGLYHESRRLRTLNEVIRARRELNEFFKEEKAANFKNITAFL